MQCNECGADMELQCDGDYSDFGWQCWNCGAFINDCESCGSCPGDGD